MELPKEAVKFSLVVQAWKGQTVIRLSPSRILWRFLLDLPVDKTHPITAFALTENPVENKEISASWTPCPDKNALERGKPGEDKKYLEPKEGSFWNDSVAPDSIISVKDSKGIHFLPISEIFDQFSETKIEENEREIIFPENMEVVGSNNKNAEWTKLELVSRHKLNGHLLRLDRSAGFIDVTPNHSIFSTDDKIVNASENPDILRVGFPKLDLQDDFSFSLNPGFLATFHDADIQTNVVRRNRKGQFLKVISGNLKANIKNRGRFGRILKATSISSNQEQSTCSGLKHSLLMSDLGELGLDLFEIFGFYVADGTAWERKAENERIPLDIRFGSLDENYLLWVGKVLNKLFYQEIKTPIVDIRTLKSGKKFYTLRVGSKALSAFFRFNFGKHDTKRIPPFILSFPKIYRQRFLKGYLIGDGEKNISHINCNTISKRLAAGLSALGCTLGHYFRVYYYPAAWGDFGGKKAWCRESYRLSSSKNALTHNLKKCCDILKENPEYVYDCQTSLDNFVLYPGSFVVHNTKNTPSSLRQLTSGTVTFFIINDFWKFLIKSKHLKGLFTLKRQGKTDLWTWKRSAGPGKKD